MSCLSSAQHVTPIFVSLIQNPRTFSNSPGFHQLITCFTFSPPALTCFRERVALEAGLSRGIAFIKISQKVTSGTQPSSPHHRPTLDRPGAPRYPFAS
ncbi:hypothetical protein PGT21_024966 [Puccinia graminis f. sp. tritici]|uniref:Uncharacterized protein n=1 Tax=Puccinia graminis f. sp. tritici TaxID=56615 RepID=A0A5B0RXE7_PUCGR|nr:hypothetical protein PGT21_024966 [Puccinia graminis f. sp. tritici]KAA1130277.1 hypothetical protein PGTUg99_003804 [Puccinia graminis f. sp. tritici]